MTYSSAQDSAFVSIPKVNATAWSFGALAIVFTIGRLAFRWHRDRRFWVDDYFHAISVAMLIAFIAISLAYLPTEEQTYLYELGLSNEEPTVDQLEWIVKMELGTILTFWLALYAVKASFLALFWLPCSLSSRLRISWWATLCLVISSFMITFFSSFWQCGSPSKLGNLEACLGIDDSLGITLLCLWCSLHVISSACLCCLAAILMNTGAFKLGKMQKIGAAVIWTLILTAILFDIVHTVYSTHPEILAQARADVYLYLLEPSVAIIACAMTGFSSSRLKRRSSVHSVDSKINFAKDEDLSRSSVQVELEPISTAALGPKAQERSLV